MTDGVRGVGHSVDYMYHPTPPTKNLKRVFKVLTHNTKHNILSLWKLNTLHKENYYEEASVDLH